MMLDKLLLLALLLLLLLLLCLLFDGAKIQIETKGSATIFRRATAQFSRCSVHDHWENERALSGLYKRFCIDQIEEEMTDCRFVTLVL